MNTKEMLEGKEELAWRRQCLAGQAVDASFVGGVAVEAYGKEREREREEKIRGLQREEGDRWWL